MTFSDLLKALDAILPNATVDEDNDGQLIIYTDLTEPVSGGPLAPFDPEN